MEKVLALKFMYSSILKKNLVFKETAIGLGICDSYKFSAWIALGYSISPIIIDNSFFEDAVKYYYMHCEKANFSNEEKEKAYRYFLHDRSSQYTDVNDINLNPKYLLNTYFYHSDLVGTPGGSELVIFNERLLDKLAREISDKVKITGRIK